MYMWLQLRGSRHRRHRQVWSIDHEAGRCCNVRNIFAITIAARLWQYCKTNDGQVSTTTIVAWGGYLVVLAVLIWVSTTSLYKTRALLLKQFDQVLYKCGIIHVNK